MELFILEHKKLWRKNLLTKVKYFEVSFKIISSIYFGVQQKGRHYIPAYINS